MDEIAWGKFLKITETACLSGWEFEADNSPYGVYATRHWNWMNSYWMFWIGRVRGARSELTRWAVSAFSEILPFRDLTAFFSFLMQENLVFFRIRSIIAYLCPNMINFYVVDFSGRRPEEVISFFWRSVYIREWEERGRKKRDTNNYTGNREKIIIILGYSSLFQIFFIPKIRYSEGLLSEAEASILGGGGGAVAPNENIGGKHIVLPPID